jgi:hypothetical protein
MRKGMKIENLIKAIKANGWAITRKEEYTRYDGTEVVDMIVMYKNFRSVSVIVENGIVTAVERISAWF